MTDAERAANTALSIYRDTLIKCLNAMVLEVQAPRSDGRPPMPGEANIDVPTLMDALAAVGGYYTSASQATPTPSDVRLRADKLRKDFIRYVWKFRTDAQKQ